MAKCRRLPPMMRQYRCGFCRNANRWTGGKATEHKAGCQIAYQWWQADRLDQKAKAECKRNPDSFRHGRFFKGKISFRVRLPCFPQPLKTITAQPLAQLT